MPAPLRPFTVDIEGWVEVDDHEFAVTWCFFDNHVPGGGPGPAITSLVRAKYHGHAQGQDFYDAYVLSADVADEAHDAVIAAGVEAAAAYRSLRLRGAA